MRGVFYKNALRARARARAHAHTHTVKITNAQFTPASQVTSVLSHGGGLLLAAQVSLTSTFLHAGTG